MPPRSVPNISGFAKGFGDAEGWGWFDRNQNVDGALLPQEITEFANAGMSVGIATVNLSDRPLEEFDGFGAACSTYGSFSYLKYGPMRLFSQMAQDSPIQLGKVIWVAGHSGPETAAPRGGSARRGDGENRPVAPSSSLA